MYIHVYEYIYLYVHSTHMFMNIIYICMYHVCVCTWNNILVWTLYRHVCTASQSHFTSHQARSALRLLQVSTPHRSLSFWAASFLSYVSSTDRPPKCSLPCPNCHSHWFTSYINLIHRMYILCTYMYILCTDQQAGRGTKEHTLTRMTVFWQGKF